jgi:hypothetical protein
MVIKINLLSSWITEFEQGTVTDWGVFLARLTAVDGWKNLKNEVQIRSMCLAHVTWGFFLLHAIVQLILMVLLLGVASSCVAWSSDQIFVSFSDL